MNLRLFTYSVIKEFKSCIYSLENLNLISSLSLSILKILSINSAWDSIPTLGKIILANLTKVIVGTFSSPNSGSTLEMYSVKISFGENIKTFLLVKSRLLYNKYATLCKAILVFPEPATPSTIKFLFFLNLIKAFCSF